MWWRRSSGGGCGGLAGCVRFGLVCCVRVVGGWGGGCGERGCLGFGVRGRPSVRRVVAWWGVCLLKVGGGGYGCGGGELR